MSHYDKFLAKLTEIFQLDRSDLDFGIYRVLNSKRDEIINFLENDLLPQVREVLAKAQSDISTAGAEELRTLESQIRAAGMSPDDSPKIRELRAKYLAGGDMEALEQEVFNQLYSFFRRYYDEGDFLSLRRYKEGVYAIPYEGEEVKLHWANADQYYIKTTEHFRDYTFKVANRSIHFKLVEAQTELDNNQASDKRVFMLSSSDPVTEEAGELVIRFEYRNDPEKRKQKDLSNVAETAILAAVPASWLGALTKKAPTDNDANRTLLTKHLTGYTARNTFDYFIHKDLGGFLRRELDNYIKNEVMHLDDIESETAQKVEQYLAKVRAIRRVASKIIDFVAQLEDFQRRLWLKKKLVVETQYLVTLNSVPEDLLPEIAANDAQLKEWIRLLAIDKIKGDLIKPGFSEPLTLSFLKSQKSLTVNTRYFTDSFRQRLLRHFPNITEVTDGVLFACDSFHALNLMRASNWKRLDCIYIDPPYNTDATEIIYKNGYKHSSWLSLLNDRISRGRELLSETGVHCLTIDDVEHSNARKLLDQVFSSDSYLATVLIRNNPSGRSTVKGFSINHEFALFHGASPASKVGRLPHSDEQRERYDLSDETGDFEWENFRKSSAGSDRASRPKQFYPLYITRDTLEIRIPECTWDEIRKEYMITDRPTTGEEMVYPLNDHRIEKVWRWGIDRANDELSSLRAKVDGNRIQVYGPKYLNEEGVLPRTWWDKSEYSARDNGTRTLRDMMGQEAGFDFPKAVAAVKDCIRVACRSGSGWVLDYFGGSGTTGHAVIELNREENAKRRFVLVEMGSHIDTVLIPRLQKAIYSPLWKSGVPSRATDENELKFTPSIMKVLRLESYEDALANLRFAVRDTTQAQLLDSNRSLRQDYMLRYVLNSELAGSQPMLNVKGFDHPFDYKLKIAADTVGETKDVNVDLVETFNWLLGLRVHTMDVIRGFHVITGRLPGPRNGDNGEKVLIIWRDTTENPNSKLDEFCQKWDVRPLDGEFDVIYVNGDNNLQNLRKDDQTWKVRLIEEEFHRLMWDVEDV